MMTAMRAARSKGQPFQIVAKRLQINVSRHHRKGTHHMGIKYIHHRHFHYNHLTPKRGCIANVMYLTTANCANVHHMVGIH